MKTEPGSDPSESRDVVRWGAGAILAVGMAVIASNLSGFLPTGFLTFLHETPGQPGNLTSLANEVSRLRMALNRAERANATFATRLGMIEGADTDFGRRVAALEASLPDLVQANGGAGVDHALQTASVGTGAGTAMPAEGGTLVVRRTPLFGGNEQPMPGPQVIPEIVADTPAEGIDVPQQTSRVATNLPTGDIIHTGSTQGNSQGLLGIAIGPPLGNAEPTDIWANMLDKAGTYLIGLEPLVPMEDDADKRLVAGPVSTAIEARNLCVVIERLNLACSPAPYAGTAIR